MDPGQKISIFLGKFSRNFDFFQLSLRKNSIYPGKFSKNLDFGIFTATSEQIILFLFKIHHFGTYFLYMIRHNNISQPFYDPLLPHDPCPKSGGRDPKPSGLTPLQHLAMIGKIVIVVRVLYEQKIMK